MQSHSTVGEIAEDALRAALLTNPEWVTLTDDERNSIANGEIALMRVDRRVLRSFEDWVQIGQSCFDLQAAVMRRSNSTNPRGRRYAENFPRIAPVRLRELHATERTAAIKFYQNADALREWYFDDTNITIHERRRLTHPKNIRSRSQNGSGSKRRGVSAATTNRATADGGPIRSGNAAPQR